MDIRSFIGKLKDGLSKTKFDDSIANETYRTIGAQYWKMISTPSKLQYLRLQAKIMEDHPDADPHIGLEKLSNGTFDNSFQNTVIGSSTTWISRVSKYLSSAAKTCKWLNWPSALMNDIEINKGAYEYAKLLQSISLYQNNPDVDASRASRYDSNGEPKTVPLSQTAMKLSFSYYDLIAYGIEQLQKLDPEAQQEKIRQGIITSSNVGWPFFVQQSKDNVFKLWRKFLKDVLHINKFEDDEPVTVHEILSIVKYCAKKNFHFPYLAFYRTQVRKVRAVFGGHILDKLIGAIVHVAKEYGLTSEACEILGIKTHADEWDYDSAGQPISEYVTKIPTYGNLPFISQLPWEIQFKILQNELPPFDRKLSSDEIQRVYGQKLPDGEYKVNVVGEDYSKFDTTIIIEDLDFLRKHKKLGWLLSYVLDDCQFSEVWTGSIRINDVIFKSGHPFTANFGTDVHLQRQFAYAESKDDVVILDVMNQSDDSAEVVINWDMEDHNKWLNEFGLSVKVEESFDYQRDKIGIYLKTLFGEVLDSEQLLIMGEPQSKYLGICHSEREITPENVDKEVGVWNITGEIQIDMCLSKLASLGPNGKPLIMEFLNLVKDTKFGSKVLMAIMNIDSSRVYKLYRIDVAASLSNPAWLGELEVRNLMVGDYGR
jgi:hypothetical protein